MATDVELIVMDKDFKRIKVIKAFYSLQWIERYYTAGEFELHCDLRFMDALYAGEYIYRKDKKHMGIIEYRQINNFSNEIIIRGRFLEAILDSRVINNTTTYRGRAEAICRQIVNQCCLSGERAIPKLRQGSGKNLGDTLEIQRTGKTVYEVLCEILNQQELGYRITYDMETDLMTFDIYMGLDRTQRQNQNTWCVFSTTFYNIVNEKYESANDKRNFAYVVGTGEGNAAITVNVNIAQAGEERKELYVDAKDIRKEEGMTDNQYRQALYDRGLTKLAEYNVSDTVECEIDMNRASFFELGDKCTYIQPQLGLVLEGRVTEICEVVENGGRNTNITLGKEQLTIIQKIKRSV